MRVLATSLALAGAAMAFLVRPIAGCAVVLCAAVLSGLDWEVPPTAIVGTYVGCVLLFPADYRIRGNLPIDLTVERFALLVILLVWLVGWIRGQRGEGDTTRVRTPLLLLFLFAVTSLIVNAQVLAVSGQLSSVIKRLLVLGGFLLVFSLVVALVTDRERVAATMRAVTSFATVAAVVAVLQRYTGINVAAALLQRVPLLENYKQVSGIVRSAGVRVTGTSIHAIEFGALMAMVLPLTIYFLFSAQDRGRRLVFAAAAAVQALGLLLSVSRSALISFAVALAVLCAFAAPPARRVLLLLVALLLFGAHLMFPGLLGTFRTMLDPRWVLRTEASTDNGRLADYPKVYAMFWRHPLLGIGYEAFEAQRYFYLDNQFLKLVLELGLAGLASVGWFFTRVCRSLAAAARDRSDESVPLAAALLASVSSYAVSMAFFDTFGFMQLTNVFFLIVALTVPLIVREPGVGTTREVFVAAPAT